MSYQYVIIGAGPTGLGAAYRLKELGIEDFLVIDASEYVGGLATTFTDEQGFLWDIGGHVQFSHYQYFDEVMDKALGKDGWLHHERESWVWMRNRFVPYPFQNNIRYLPEEEMWQCLSGIIDNYKNPSLPPNNFKEWILATFGKGIADVFMLPYNFKVWAYPPEELAYHWIGDRVAVTDLKRVTKNILFENDDVSWGPNNTFRFPEHGGTGSIWKRVGEMIGEEKFRLGHGVENIQANNKQLILSDGSKVEYEHLLSTIPLDLLAQSIDELPQKKKERAQELKYSSSNIIGLGLKGQPKEELRSKCWMYFPENDNPFYRVTVFSNYSPNNVPDINQHWSLMTETSESPAKPVDQDNILEETIQGCLNTGLIQDRSEIISTWHYRAGHGYPTPSLERDEIFADILPAIEELGIHSRGRFGAWKYEISNQDHSMMQGVEWVNKMQLDIPEVTINFPGTANANWGRK